MDLLHLVLTVISALIVLGIIWCLTEPFLLVLDKVRLKKSSGTNNTDGEIVIKKLPKTDNISQNSPDFRFFFFSDVHAEWCPVTSKRVCNAIREANKAAPVDAVIFGGDLITYTHNASLGLKYLSNVSRCCKELGIPFYGVNGNHDTYIDDAPGKSGYTDLNNKGLILTSAFSGKKAVLAGVSDSGRKHRVWQPLPVSNGSEPIILIAHDPDALINLPFDTRPDYMLSGHLHGGQMKLPFRMEFKVLRKMDKLPKMGAVEGVYEINGTTVFISRGLGCGIMPFRFLSVPEVTVVEISL